MLLTFIHEDGQGGKLVNGEGMDVNEEEGEVKQLITLSTMVTKETHAVTSADASMHNTGTPEHLQLSIPKAAQKIGMTASTAYRHLKVYQDDPEQQLPGTRKHISEYCNLDHTITLREEFVKEWASHEEEFLNRTIFINEAGFHLHMVQSEGWSPIGLKEGKVAGSSKTIQQNNGD
ncbi:MAG: hypothetical protein BYD32DRAFT_461694 [Podila humilis]|nr:MAG: hypothetical protein BYD32DRAFT_461694 [Podila humilis]